MAKEIIDEYIDPEWNILKNNLGITTNKELRQAETDIAIVKIAELINTNYFEPTIEYLKYINNYLFGDIYPFAGTFRTVPFFKHEPTLQLLSVEYSLPENIEKELILVFDRIKNTDFESLNINEQIDYIGDVISEIWKIHPFREGNTRTTLVFMRALLKSYGLTFSATLFQSYGNFHWMRDALIAAVFESEELNVRKNKTYINRVISDIIEDNLKMKRGR